MRKEATKSKKYTIRGTFGYFRGFFGETEMKFSGEIFWVCLFVLRSLFFNELTRKGINAFLNSGLNLRI